MIRDRGEENIERLKYEFAQEMGLQTRSDNQDENEKKNNK